MSKQAKGSSVFLSRRRGTAGQNGSGSGPNPTTPAEKSVQFINAEVLDPPKEGSISFVTPLYSQTLVMALEDARSFVQGAEQILLVALAKALEKYLSGGAASPKSLLEVAGLQPSADRDEETGGKGAGGYSPQDKAPVPPDGGLQAIQSVMESLTRFHASMAETAHKYKGDS